MSGSTIELVRSKSCNRPLHTSTAVQRRPINVAHYVLNRRTSWTAHVARITETIMHTKLLENYVRRGHLKYLGSSERIILKWIAGK
jgi:hypothetical protein